MRRLVIVLSIVVLALFILAPVASADNAGWVNTGNDTCVVLGSGKASPVDNGVLPHTRGLAHAAHAGQDNSAVQHGSCPS